MIVTAILVASPPFRPHVLTRPVLPPVANVTSYLVDDNGSLHQRLLAKHPGKAAVKSRLSETVPWYKGPISERQYSVSRDDVT